MTEAREKIAQTIATPHGEETPCRVCCMIADQILALEGEDWRIAVVKKDDDTSCGYISLVAARHSLTSASCPKAGWVEEVL